MKKILEVNNFSFSYKDKDILNNIDLNIPTATINAIIGANASGKTTLIRALSGNLTFSKDIELCNIPLIRGNRTEYLRHCDIVYIATDKKLKFNSVKLLMRYQLQSRGYNLKQSRDRIKEISDKFNIKELIDKKVSKLNMLDKTKALLIAAVIHKPEVLFVDDLFCGLDFNGCCVISELLNEIRDTGITIIFSTNRLDACIACNNIYFLNEGKLEKYDSLTSLIKKDNILSRNGIIIPPMLDLSQKLRDYDILNDIVYTPEGMVDSLWK